MQESDYVIVFAGFFFSLSPPPSFLFFYFHKCRKQVVAELGSIIGAFSAFFFLRYRVHHAFVGVPRGESGISRRPSSLPSFPFLPPARCREKIEKIGK